MAQSIQNSDMHVNGALSCNTFSVASATITDAMISATAGISASKSKVRTVIPIEIAGPTTTIAAVSKLLNVLRAAGTLVALEAYVVTKATGTDRTVTVDLHRSAAGGAFATVLSGTIGFTSGSTNLTPSAATFSATSLADNDILKLVVTVAGSSGNQALGGCATLTMDLDPS